MLNVGKRPGKKQACVLEKSGLRVGREGEICGTDSSTSFRRGYRDGLY